MSVADEIRDVTEGSGVPKGWEPFAEHAGSIGSAIVRLPAPNATQRDLLVASGFDPDEWAIDGNVQVRRWMRYDQEWLYYYRFNVTQDTESAEHRAADIDGLVKMLRRRKRSAPVVPEGHDAWAFLASDWQIGKREGGVGTPETAQRVGDAIDDAVRQVKALRRIGRQMPTGAFAATGDLGEGTCGFYPNQPFLIDCNRREQGRVIRSLITYGIDELAPLFDDFHVLTVGGNHGENRNDGAKITDDGDNDDVAHFEAVREAVDRSGQPANVHWHIPGDELSMALELGGVKVGFTHGHLFRQGGKLVQAKALEWWKGQAFGFQAVSGARVLVSSHFHHFSAIDHGGRTHFQTPAADPGSKWFRESSGADSPAGVLTLRFDSERPLGWGDLEIL